MRFACFTTSSTVKRKRLWLGVRDVKRKYYVRCAQQKQSPLNRTTRLCIRFLWVIATKYAHVTFHWLDEKARV